MERRSSTETGSLTIVGIGPGDRELVTPLAERALRSADVIVGYDTYADLLRTWLPNARYDASSIGHEMERAEAAIAHALAGRSAVLVGSGDAGVYGLAGLALELLAQRNATTLEVTVVPGVTAAVAAAALLGAPLGHDFAVISLSDLLTPWDTIRRRLEAAASADFVTVLYNPSSRSRKSGLQETKAIFLRFRDAGTPVGHVVSAYRGGQRVSVTSLQEFDPGTAGMLSTVVIGNRATWRWQERMITPRGYSPERSHPGAAPAEA